MTLRERIGLALTRRLLGRLSLAGRVQELEADVARLVGAGCWSKWTTHTGKADHSAGSVSCIMSPDGTEGRSDRAGRGANRSSCGPSDSGSAAGGAGAMRRGASSGAMEPAHQSVVQPSARLADGDGLADDRCVADLAQALRRPQRAALNQGRDDADPLGEREHIRHAGLQSAMAPLAIAIRYPADTDGSLARGSDSDRRGKDLP